MNFVNRTRTVGLLCGILIAISACAPRYGSIIRSKGQSEGWTKEQQAVAEHISYRLKFTKENPDTTFSINYSVLSNQLVSRIVKQRLNDLDQILDYKNTDWGPFIKAFNLRPELEREERDFKAIYARLTLVDNYNNFKDFMGERSANEPHDLQRGYDSSKVFVSNVFSAYPFMSDRIDQARKNGKLSEVERFISSSVRLFDHKEPDPTDPDDPNKFIWQKVQIAVEFVSYKILDTPSPRDNNVDYVEGTRIKVDADGSMKRESKPALKLFVPTLGSGAVLVIDKDREGEVGYMLPDFVERIGSTTSAKELLNDAMISRLFPQTDKEKRIKPKDPVPIMLEIAPVGKKIDVWEYNTSDGWIVPFRYKNERSDNYTTSLKIKGSEQDHFDSSASNKEIEHFKKEWTTNGHVVEYFHPKSPYNQANITSVEMQGNRVLIVTNQGQELTGHITTGSNLVIDDRPYAIEYTESQIRWLLADENGDGKFEKRRQISK